MIVARRHRPPQDITVTITGRSRADVAHGIREVAKIIDEQFTGRRAKTEMGRMMLGKAQELRHLAMTIDV